MLLRSIRIYISVLWSRIRNAFNISRIIYTIAVHISCKIRVTVDDPRSCCCCKSCRRTNITKHMAGSDVRTLLLSYPFSWMDERSDRCCYSLLYMRDYIDERCCYSPLLISAIYGSLYPLRIRL